MIFSQLLGLLNAPATQLVRLLNEPGSYLARVIDAIGKKNGAGEAPPATPSFIGACAGSAGGSELLRLRADAENFWSRAERARMIKLNDPVE